MFLDPFHSQRIRVTYSYGTPALFRQLPLSIPLSLSPSSRTCAGYQEARRVAYKVEKNDKGEGEGRTRRRRRLVCIKINLI